MGTAYYAMEEYDSAQSHLERSLEIDPNYATGWGQLGWVFYVQKDYDKAQPNFEKAVDLEKDPARNATYRHALGWIYLNTKQYDKAKQEFTRALEENPDLDGAKEGLQVPGHATRAAVQVDAPSARASARACLLMYSRVGGGHLSGGAGAGRGAGGHRARPRPDWSTLRGVRPISGHAVSARLRAAGAQPPALVVDACTTARARPRRRRACCGPFLRAGSGALLRRGAAGPGRSRCCRSSTGCWPRQPTAGARSKWSSPTGTPCIGSGSRAASSHYTAPTDSARQDCIRFGAPPDAVDVVGIPVRRAFARAAPRSAPADSPRPDASRFWPWSAPKARRARIANIARWRSSTWTAQLVVVCGRNEALRQQVERCQRACRCTRSASSTTSPS